MMVRKILFGSIIIFFTLTLIILSCKKEDSNPVPNKDINIYINPNSTQYLELNTVGGWVYLTDGVGGKGLLVYRLSNEQFLAFDRTCTYDPNEACAIIEMESSGLNAIDSCCGSRFLIIDGSVTTGPATVSLKQYKTTYDGNMLHIYD
ncbi:hypothetical protein ACFL6I_05060 [candidate division KSB1 bacterium]